MCSIALTIGPGVEGVKECQDAASNASRGGFKANDATGANDAKEDRKKYAADDSKRARNRWSVSSTCAGSPESTRRILITLASVSALASLAFKHPSCQDWLSPDRGCRLARSFGNAKDATGARDAKGQKYWETANGCMCVVDET